MERAWFKFNLSYPMTLVGVSVFVILGSIAMTALYDHFRLTVRVDGTIDHWKVIKKSSSSYPIRGSYHFDFQDKTYQGSSLLSAPYHLNRSSAEKEIHQLKTEGWKIWIDPHHPYISALEKVFPMKKIVYACVALGVTFYFWFVETSSRIRNPTNRIHHRNP